MSLQVPRSNNACLPPLSRNSIQYTERNWINQIAITSPFRFLPQRDWTAGEVPTQSKETPGKRRLSNRDGPDQSERVSLLRSDMRMHPPSWSFWWSTAPIRRRLRELHPPMKDNIIGKWCDHYWTARIPTHEQSAREYLFTYHYHIRFHSGKVVKVSS